MNGKDKRRRFGKIPLINHRNEIFLWYRLLHIFFLIIIVIINAWQYSIEAHSEHLNFLFVIFDLHERNLNTCNNIISSVYINQLRFIYLLKILFCRSTPTKKCAATEEENIFG